MSRTVRVVVVLGVAVLAWEWSGWGVLPAGPSAPFGDLADPDRVVIASIDPRISVNPAATPGSAEVGVGRARLPPSLDVEGSAGASPSQHQSRTAISALPWAATPDQRRMLHGYPVLGEVEVTGGWQRWWVVNAVRKPIAGADQNRFSFCFRPRHVVRIIKGDRLVELVVCFECENMRCHDAAGVPIAP